MSLSSLEFFFLVTQNPVIFFPVAALLLAGENLETFLFLPEEMVAQLPPP